MTRSFVVHNFIHNYNEKCESEEVRKGIRIRENDGKWREPLVEVEE